MTETLRTVIVDDEPLARRVLERLLANHPGVELVGSVADGLEALALLAQVRVDLILADIAMPNLAGLELVERLPCERPTVVFVTAYSDHAARAFELGVTDYLLKPVAPERLDLALVRARSTLRAERRLDLTSMVREFGAARAISRTEDHLWVHRGGGRERVALADVEVIRAEGDYVRVFTATMDRLADGSLDRLDAELSLSGFLRVHR